jgi:hypothetical protein
MIQGDIPPALKGLTDIEEMIISLVLPIMQVRYTKGGQLSYQEHVCNFVQDISNIAEHLPCLPEECEVILIRKEGTELGNHVDFIVRRGKVLEALRWKIQHDPAYAHISLEDPQTMARIDELPQNGSVAHRLRSIPVGTTTGGNSSTPAAAGPPDAGAENEEEEDEGVEQSGVLNLGSAGSSRTEVAAIRSEVEPVLGGPVRYGQQQRYILSLFSCLGVASHILLGATTRKGQHAYP